MTENFENSAVSTIDLKKYLFKILSHWYLFVVAILIAWAYVYVQNKYVIPSYEVNTIILLGEKSKKPESVLGGLKLSVDKKNLENETWFLKSFVFNYAVLNELDFDISYYDIKTVFSFGKPVFKELYRNTPFVVNLDTSRYNQKGVLVKLNILNEEEYRIYEIGSQEVNIVAKFGAEYNSSSFNFNLNLKNDIKVEKIVGKNYALVINDVERMARNYGANLRVAPVTKDGDILRLSFTNEVAQKACDYLNKLVSLYIRQDLLQKNQFAISSINFIDEQLNSVSDSLSVAEDSLQTYRLKAQMFTGDKQASSVFTKLEELQNQKAFINIEKNYYNYILEQINTNDNAYTIMAPEIMGVSAPDISGSFTQWVNLYSEKELLKYSIKKDVPEMQLINVKIENVKKILKNSIENRINVANSSIQELNSEINKLVSQLYELPYAERKISTITRKFNINDNIYTYLLQKRAEAGLTLASNKSEIIVLDEALTQNMRYILSGKTSYSTAIVISLLIPLGLILLREYFDNKIREKTDITSKVKVPVIGEVGNNHYSTSMPVFTRPKSSIAESFRILRTNLKYLLVDKSKKVVTMTSTVSGEGKTFCAINLAAIIAMSNKKTILIGLDMRKPQIHNYLNISNDIGISNYLVGSNSLEDAIQTTEHKNLDILVSGPPPPNPAELIETKRMEDLIESLKEKYDYVIIDTPPVALVTDALLLSRFSDTTVYVTRLNYSHKNVVNLIKDFHSKGALKNMAILINDIKVQKGYGYLGGYRYGGYSYYSYSNYYGQGYYDDGESPAQKRKTWLKKLFLKNKKA